ncbi:putative 2-haloalkanoic acid dehalogenase [Cryphonectria parasitica EP155]|uniref:2-haloalkanoic acid dehalogenase n=1 Tax=Cryphonectria parasitica (strain ATCC 38755 / EP155) TaxID=660469 RepID=A0A9P4XZL0_CRYP1|nr:putative 2-haloalkanoic acid dehalogenase [Cryphonectria parasitica EP155]KAF3763677.1 putative 2-haloalkanoic acid dehalogenase [Cryphonectria parasitica EP155]
MVTGGKHVVFDIVGTCVGYEAWYEAIEGQIGDRLKAHGINTRLFAFAWLESSEREFTFLDLSGRYSPYFPVFRSLFHRVLAQVGVPNVRQEFSDEDADVCAAGYAALRARPGVAEAWQKLRDAGFTVWALTTGDKQRVRGYLSRAGLEVADENFVTCDGLDVRKPAPKAYRYVLDKFTGAEQTWFAAAHMWDASGAKASGFKAAWCSVWECEPVPETFGEVDVVADSLVEMAEKIIEKSKQ